MSNKPDKKARRGRTKAAKKAAAPAVPAVTLRELFGRKRKMIAENRAELRMLLRRAPRLAHGEYRRCLARIRRALSERASPQDKVEAVLYPAARRNTPLSNAELHWLFALLSHPANGWEVSLSKPLGARDDYDDEAKLLFRFDPHGD